MKLMKQILVYSDSLTWGIIPDTRQRLDFDSRWPGILEDMLNAGSHPVRIIENCLNGRRTAWDDPFKDGRDGSVGLSEVIEMHSPLCLVILMLGTNDFQSVHNNSAALSAQGIGKLINIIRNAPIEPGMPVPQILVVCPPRITKPMGTVAYKFEGAESRYGTFPDELAKVCELHDVALFDSNSVIKSSRIDGIHLDAAEHRILGEALADYIQHAKFF